MFRGKFDTTIDAKGRTSIPAKFREVLVDSFGDERFFLTKSSPLRLGGGAMGYGLVIYPYTEFLALEERLKDGAALGFSVEQLAAVRRTVLVPAVECTADKLGRILVPTDLRKTAQLERELHFVGMQKKIDIYSQAVWAQVCAQDEQNFPLDSPALAGLGL
ncbi:division/cell wall cluster transcriptional repressor MraZ [Geomonas sp. Red69]|uniref:Transcriptional regulator MraZ n=1 Tax=Geomonas diazotrophica TaxID=2843197 RepID=A0ABX8JHT2_9BACT|nr:MULTISPECIES: division/cell wall cluster transcriptional repressor MraZ [Geomonas]MBU5637402.1 division/cell wall cluster transcriptional repressor MraZ [Geomonas diazotrophica]QWV97930.1 division/cell wall cluster transcriptional repressor MraZ [Geomonas nitrogeniifigens]QXE87070.1 division/cell wall cluster transcriptional repressor MraZ [Geomonas nitrogeniifigens]